MPSSPLMEYGCLLCDVAMVQMAGICTPHCSEFAAGFLPVKGSYLTLIGLDMPRRYRTA